MAANSMHTRVKQVLQQPVISRASAGSMRTRLLQWLSARTPLLCQLPHQTNPGEARSYHTAAPILLREYIHQSLYNPDCGYFTSSSPPVGRLPEPIDFRKLVNQAEYRLVLDRLHSQLGVDWLTPSEIFRPWWGQGVAKYILETRQHVWKSAEPLQIVEIGGGAGSFAASILDYLAAHDPLLYASTSYVCIDISPSLAALQQQTVVEACGHRGGVFTSIVADAASPGAWSQAAEAAAERAAAAGGGKQGASAPSSRSRQVNEEGVSHGLCFVLMMEVLDNQPHDRICRDTSTGGWQQVVAVPVGSSGSSNQQQWEQQLQPLTDPLIQRCLAAAEPPGGWGQGRGASQEGGGSRWLQRLLDTAMGQAAVSEVYLPTACLQLLERIAACRPRHTLLAADFDALPDVQLPGLNAPLVSGRRAPGRPQDYDTLMVPWGAADIFFPTDFDMLERLYMSATAAGPSALTSPQPQAGQKGWQTIRQQGQADTWCSHASTADFMTSFVGSKATRTLSGYNPLLQDWGNTRFFEGHTGLLRS